MLTVHPGNYHDNKLGICEHYTVKNVKLKIKCYTCYFCTLHTKQLTFRIRFIQHFKNQPVAEQFHLKISMENCFIVKQMTDTSPVNDQLFTVLFVIVL